MSLGMPKLGNRDNGSFAPSQSKRHPLLASAPALAAITDDDFNRPIYPVPVPVPVPVSPFLLYLAQQPTITASWSFF